MGRKHVEVGTTDRCRTCNKPIMWTKATYKYQWDKEEREHTILEWFHFTVKGGKGLEREYQRQCSDETGQNLTLRAHAQPKSYCTETNHSGYDRYCHRPVKDAELGLCGIHARPHREQAKRRAAQEEHYKEQSYIRGEVEKICTKLETEFGLKASVHSRTFRTNTFPYTDSVVTGSVVVDPHELLSALEDEKF